MTTERRLTLQLWSILPAESARSTKQLVKLIATVPCVKFRCPPPTIETEEPKFIELRCLSIVSLFLFLVDKGNSANCCPAGYGLVTKG